ncbi:ferredoxin--nitrite reductase [Dolichospermum circinale]|uniref:ferredoxin--nitrite reductase n=1 Tax=Dolichospermum circinale TaxID=109265 RepID=UPI00232F39F8|nr:ferredoxin--nitrite reductase [Dolichospermum circinale]MDB9468438.1 ferredoxin--nitrite reductase [Dolichospermum circinale CS-539/09]MDB9472949.1 ferredoxin--nitrite reductase [Dolichospermum circinale CS-539]
MIDTAATTEKLNKFEKFKAEKDGLAVKNEIEQFAQIGWEAMDENDLNHRLKWLGVFFRPVTPGKFMMRMRIPNGILTSNQLSVLAEVVQRYGDDGSADITTRQNIQLRGIKIQDIPNIFNKFNKVGLTTIQSGMDNIRNITGDTVAGLDINELYDTRELVQQIQDMLTNNGEGNPEFSNLPRKFNIAITGGKDNSVHAEINDLAFIPAFLTNQEQIPVFGFNVIVGGLFSAKRCETAIPLNVWVLPADVVSLSKVIVEIFRDHGLRANRQKARLIWLLDEWGIEKFRTEVEKRFGKSLLPAAAKDEIDWEKRDHLGIYKQKQAGFNYAGLNIPVGRLSAHDMLEIARLAEVYGSGEIRFTVEQNIIIPNIPDSSLTTFFTEGILEKFAVNPGLLMGSLVSCTGAQFCNFALIETKNRALEMIKSLESELTLSSPVRIHWTGCPNSCGQPQVADIGLMGTKVRKNGQMLEGVDIYMGGTAGKDAHLGTCVQKGIPCEDLQPILRDLLIHNFGAKLREPAIA